MAPDGGDPAAPVICVDGPGGSGKSTLAALLADSLQWRHLDSGALYRLVAAAALERGMSLEDREALAGLAARLDFRFEDADPAVSGEAPGPDIRSEPVGAAASTIAAYPELRSAILSRQRAARRPPGLVADGRDMGTVVFPDAPLKIYLDANPEVRAERRNKQLKNKGLNVSFRALLVGIHERDARDRERAAAPLKPAGDAVVIDSTAMNLDEVLGQALALVRERGLDR
ncbi:MAG: (d)CMP kinase [Gammaproteobacteria bacterium]|nr:(d)CMP kinase [Gammaproteobacteria bacterium]MDE0364229.1 (d)CMP kinase [Gammaproteobacteria bacterium]